MFLYQYKTYYQHFYNEYKIKNDLQWMIISIEFKLSELN